MNTPASLKLSEHFKIRFMKKNHLRLPLFALLMTQTGLQYYRSNSNSADFIKGNAIAGIKEYTKHTHTAVHNYGVTPLRYSLPHH